MEVPDPVALLEALSFVGDLSNSHCPAPSSPALLCIEERTISSVMSTGLPTLRLTLSLRFQDALAVVATCSSYAICSGRFIESLADLVEALYMADAYLNWLAISREDAALLLAKVQHA